MMGDCKLACLVNLPPNHFLHQISYCRSSFQNQVRLPTFPTALDVPDHHLFLQDDRYLCSLPVQFPFLYLCLRGGHILLTFYSTSFLSSIRAASQAMDSQLAAPPPPGVTVHMNNPQTNNMELGIAIGIAAISLSTLFLLLRLVTRIVYVKSLGLDDLFISLSWAMATVFQATVIYLRASKQIGVHIWETTISEVNTALLVSSEHPKFEPLLTTHSTSKSTQSCFWPS